jgi:murein DD-endopeptidase MepM/ murein hydrolase activator NlpD
MSGYAVKVGWHVTQGQVIGYVGTTGYSTGCHLHFMLWVNGTMVNPANYL